MLHRPAPLTVPGVYKTLRQIALEKGQGSAARRQRAVLAMLRSCRSVSASMACMSSAALANKALSAATACKHDRSLSLP